MGSLNLAFSYQHPNVIFSSTQFGDKVYFIDNAGGLYSINLKSGEVKKISSGATTFACGMTIVANSSAIQNDFNVTTLQIIELSSGFSQTIGNPGFGVTPRRSGQGATSADGNIGLLSNYTNGLLTRFNASTYVTDTVSMTPNTARWDIVRAGSGFFLAADRSGYVQALSSAGVPQGNMNVISSAYVGRGTDYFNSVTPTGIVTSLGMEKYGNSSANFVVNTAEGVNFVFNSSSTGTFSNSYLDYLSPGFPALSLDNSGSCLSAMACGIFLEVPFTVRQTTSSTSVSLCRLGSSYGAGISDSLSTQLSAEAQIALPLLGQSIQDCDIHDGLGLLWVLTGGNASAKSFYVFNIPPIYNAGPVPTEIQDPVGSFAAGRVLRIRETLFSQGLLDGDIGLGLAQQIFISGESSEFSEIAIEGSKSQWRKFFT